MIFSVLTLTKLMTERSFSLSSKKSLRLRGWYFVIEKLDVFFVADLAAKPGVLAQERNHSLSRTALQAGYFCAELALHLLLDLVPAVGAHLGRLLLFFVHLLGSCELGVDICVEN